MITMRIKNLLKLLWCILLIAPTANITAQKRQSAHSDSLLQHHFEPGTKLQWTRVYQVRLDDVQEMHLVLGYDGLQCNGWLEYPASGQKATIKGRLTDQDMLLVELNRELKVVATLEGRLDARKITGQRILSDRKSAQKLEGQSLSPLAIKTNNLPCSDNKWYLKYRLKWDGRDATLLVSKLQAGMLVGMIAFEEQLPFYTLKGKFLTEDKCLIQVTTMPDKQHFGTLKGSFDQINKVSLTLEQNGKIKTYLHCTLDEQLNVNCSQDLVNNTSIDAVYPRTKSEAFNTLLDQRIKSWMQQMSGLARQKNQAHTASSWTELTCWQDDFMCAVTTYHTSWDTTWHSTVHLFNLKKKKELALEDLFQERFDYKTWFKAQELKHLPGVVAYGRDKQYANWLDTHGFPVQYFNQNGLVLSSLFHPVYGTSEIFLPWVTLKPYLRSGSVLKNLVR